MTDNQYELWKKLKDAGIEISKGKVVGYWCKAVTTVSEGWHYRDVSVFKEEPQNGIDFIENLGRDGYRKFIEFVPTTDTKTLMEILPDEIDGYENQMSVHAMNCGKKYLHLRYEGCMSSHHEIYTDTHGKEASFIGSSPDEALVEMLVYLKGKGLIG